MTAAGGDPRARALAAGVDVPRRAMDYSGI
jgi:hypothetical protein